MKKVLYIVGTTATGKTDLALKLATKFHGHIVSADSRQIYTHLTIGTGKDIPKGFTKTTTENMVVYQKDDVGIWGYDLTEPNQDYSVSVYAKAAKKIITYLHKHEFLPIITGGTGFYCDSIESPPDSINIPINQPLRDTLTNDSISTMQQKLQTLNNNRFHTMNHSDAHNPRRLVRAIEIETYKKTQQTPTVTRPIYDALWIGLKADIDLIDKKIRTRVQQRLKKGFEAEFDQLIKDGILDTDSQAGSSTGYRQWFEYKKGKLTKKEAIEKWTQTETQYARKQLTWFKKNKRIQWFDPSASNYLESVVQTIKNWYS